MTFVVEKEGNEFFFFFAQTDNKTQLDAAQCLGLKVGGGGK